MMWFWKVKKIISYEENILKEALETSGLVTGLLREALFSLVNVGTIRVAKTLEMNSLILQNYQMERKCWVGVSHLLYPPESPSMTVIMIY